MSAAAANFRVVSHDDYGQPVRCSYCMRGAKRVVVMPLPSNDQIEAANGNEMWLGLCAYCVLEMARLLAAVEGTAP